MADNSVMRDRPNPLDTLLTALASWLPVVGGMTLLGMVLITPQWLDWRELAWQRDVLEIQADRLQSQRERYTRFYEALSADDPVLLERLAFTQLRLKPVGKRVMPDLFVSGQAPNRPAISSASSVIRQHPAEPFNPPQEAEAIEAWLAAPQPIVGRDIPPLAPMNTRLTRLTQGPAGYVLLFVAILCLTAGLLPHESETLDSGDEADESDGNELFAASSLHSGSREQLNMASTPRLRLAGHITRRGA
ncbi:MAG: hypothetical protein Kow00105_19540 [Phycisphaeraceae bacterium]